MKKLLLVAALGVAGLVSAKIEIKQKFVRNESKKENYTFAITYNNQEKSYFLQECGIYINYYDDFGFIYKTEYRSSEQSSLSDCNKWQDMQKFMLMADGYYLTPI